jgi:hypothetical protein|tara:strand:+ start:869 stop:1144 length:276 start_codon:yes stop_codon:yes gene_type:complete
MENITSTDDVNYDRRLYTLYRMGFESARLDDTTGRTRISNNRSDDRQFRYMDECGEVRAKKNGEGRTMRKYLKRLWCALWNKKCHDDCDCV